VLLIVEKSFANDKSGKTEKQCADPTNDLHHFWRNAAARLIDEARNLAKYARQQHT